MKRLFLILFVGLAWMVAALTGAERSQVKPLETYGWSREYLSQANPMQFLEQRGPKAPVANVIWDLDAGVDVDDALDMMELFQMDAEGRLRILGFTQCLTNWFSTPAVEVFCRYYGKPNLPIGGTRNGIVPNPPAVDAWGGNVVNAFLPPMGNTTNSEVAVRVARRILASQTNGSVTLAYAGQLRNLKDLWESPADDLSPLTGSVLVQAKVREIVVCAGVWPGTASAEANLANDPAAGAILNVITNGPPVRYVGIELGNSVVVGTTLVAQRSASNPGREAMRSWCAYVSQPTTVGRPAWAGLMALYIGYGTSDRGTNYFTYGPAGFGVVNASNGTNSFTTNAVGTHKYLLKAQADPVYVAILDGLALKDPVGKTLAEVGEFASGTLTEPGIRFRSAVTKGLYNPSSASAGGMGYTEAGSEWVRFFGDGPNSRGGIVLDGTRGGIWWAAGALGSTTVQMGFRQDGATGYRFSDVASTNTFGYERLAAVEFGNTTTRITNGVALLADGAVGAPSYSFGAVTGKGFYNPNSSAGGGVGFAEGGSEWARFFGDAGNSRGGIVLDGTRGGIWWAAGQLGSTTVQMGFRQEGANGYRFSDVVSTNTFGYERLASVLLGAGFAGMTNDSGTNVTALGNWQVAGTAGVTGTLTASGTVVVGGKVTLNSSWDWFGTTNAVQQADQNVTSSTVAVDATDLICPLVANKKYRFRGVVLLSTAGTASGYQVKLAGPASPTTVMYSSFGQDTSNATVTTGGVSYTTVQSRAAAAMNSFNVEVSGYIENGANAGNFSIQFAQKVSDPSAVTMKKGSYLTVERLN